jgi:hypothetical protein
LVAGVVVWGLLRVGALWGDGWEGWLSGLERIWVRSLGRGGLFDVPLPLVWLTVGVHAYGRRQQRMKNFHAYPVGFGISPVWMSDEDDDKKKNFFFFHPI